MNNDNDTHHQKCRDTKKIKPAMMMTDLEYFVLFCSLKFIFKMHDKKKICMMFGRLWCFRGLS